MIDYNHCRLDLVSAHYVGNISNDEELKLSEKLLDISDSHLTGLLCHFFLSNFNSPEMFSFTFSNDDIEFNPVYNYTKSIFDDPDCLHEQSVSLAKHLFEISVHPNIKPGDFFIAYFSSLEFEDRKYEAIGLFKSETKDSFIKLVSNDITYDDGISINKLDKGCLVFNTNEAGGYKVLILDKSNRSTEAQYWRDHFLNLKPCADEFQHTKNYLTITKNYVTEQLNNDFEVTRADQIDFLNRSMDYFKNHEQFDEKEFTVNVFQNEDVIESFNKFKSNFIEEKDLPFADNFSISTPAVKKQSRVYKSVLKLDKNFHIYIHGDRTLIEKGVDDDGRKYYKIYFNEEA